MDFFKRRNREPEGVGGPEASMRIRDILDPSVGACTEIEMTDAANDVVFNVVLLRALESIKGEFHERTWLAFWKVVVEGRSASDVATDLSM